MLLGFVGQAGGVDGLGEVVGDVYTIEPGSFDSLHR